MLKKFYFSLLLLVGGMAYSSSTLSPQACTPDFTVPDTVCVKQLIQLTNQNVCAATTNYWSFCSGNLNDMPVGTNIGNPGGQLSWPVFVSLVQDNNVKYAFVTNHLTGSSSDGQVVRLKYGSSYLNTPTVTNFGDMGIANYIYVEGIQVRKDGNGNWYGFTCSGGLSYSKVVRLNFGTSLDNTPTATDLGNLGNMTFPGELYLFQEGANWYAMVSNSQGNSIVRLSFGTSLGNTPTATNLGNFGLFSQVGEFGFVKDVSNNWHVFVGNNNNITRLDFGNSLLNTPTGQTYTPPFQPYGIKLMKDCDHVFGFITHPNNTITKMDFPNGITGAPVFTNLGNIASFDFPHSISDIFREDDSLYVFIPNVYSYTLSKLIWKNCTNASIPSSTLPNPPAYSYNQPGTYNVSLTINEGTINQGTFCRTIVVLDSIKKPDATTNAVCSGDTIKLRINNIDNTAQYSWTGPNGFTASTANVNVLNANGTKTGQYIVTATGRCGVKKDTVTVSLITGNVNLGRDTSICTGAQLVLNATTPSATYLWSTGATSPTITVNTAGTYSVRVTVSGCIARDTIIVSQIQKPAAFSIGNDTTYCGSFSRVLSTGNATTTWSTGATGSQITVNQPGTYIATITNTCGSTKDTIVISQTIVLVNLGRDTAICSGAQLVLNATTAGATYLWSTGATSPTITVNTAGTYSVRVTSSGGCIARDTVVVSLIQKPAAFNLGNDTTYCGNFVRVLSTGNASTTWSTGSTGAAITVTQPGTYIATITNTCGSTKDTIVISQNPVPVVNLGRDTSICNGTQLVLNATTPNATYSWSTGASSPTITVNSAGTFSVLVTVNNCSDRDTINVSIIQKPASFNLGNDTTYCGGFVRVLSTGNATTTWNTGATASTITVNQAGTYIATITNTCGAASDTIIISQNPIPIVNLGRDTAICNGTGITLDATTLNATYVWSDGSNSSSINVTQAGTYWVQVTVNGCSKTDSIHITTVNPPVAFDLGNDTSYCGPFNRVLSTGNQTATWSTGDHSTTITVNQAGTYSAVVANACGSETDSILIAQFSLPAVALGKDTAICDSTIELTVNSQGLASILWSTGDTTASITVTTEGVYWVVVTDNKSCRNSDTVNVGNNCITDIFIPNAFTPNGDGINDLFIPLASIKDITVDKFEIFSRWGEMMFKAENFNIADKQNAWNGTFKGVNCQVDTYAYLVELTVKENGVLIKKSYKGTVTLLR